MKKTEGIDEKIKAVIQELREIDIRKLRKMCFGLRESAEDTSNLKSIIYDVLEIPEADFPFQDIRPIRIGQLRKKNITSY